MKRILILTFCTIILASCANNKVKITGIIENAKNQVLHLDKIDVYNTIPIDTLVLKKHGRFSFTFKSKEPRFYQLRLSPEKIIVLFPNPGDKIQVKGDAKNIISSLEINGSNDTKQITNLIKGLTKTQQRLDSISVIYEKTTNDSLRKKLNKEYQKILDIHRKASIVYVITNYKSLSSIYALYQQYQPGYYVFYKTTDLQYFKILSDSLSKYYPKSNHVQSLVAYTDKLIGDFKASKLFQSEKVTETLPAIKLPDFAGDTTSLYSLKGKYVLLSFWVSNNQVCISQNLQLKKVYEKYRNRGFEIFQVSFDKSRERWQKAVTYDQLPWISVIDDKYPNTAIVGNYNIQQLPANYLIDKNNYTILARNLTPTQLKDKLDDLFN